MIESYSKFLLKNHVRISFFPSPRAGPWWRTNAYEQYKFWFIFSSFERRNFEVVPQIWLFDVMYDVYGL